MTNMEEESQHHHKPQTDSTRFLAVSILIAAAMISGSIIYLVKNGNQGSLMQAAGNTGTNQNDQTAANPADLQIGGRDVILGSANAPVTLIEYGDYQCPFCGRFFTESDLQIRKDYVQSGQVKMVFRNMSFLGPESDAAAAAAECAKDQSKFWAYHDALYTTEIADGKENSGNLTRDLFVKLAGDLKMDTTAFAKCVDSGQYSAQVQKDTAAAHDVGVNSTPTIFINGQKFTGALPYAQFKAAIDMALKTK